MKPFVKNGKAEFFDLFVDGFRVGRCKPGEDFSIDTTRLADGYHELRVVATENTPIETLSRWVGEIVVKNGMDALELSADTSDLSDSTKALNVNVASSAKQSVSIQHNGRIIATIKRGSGSVLIPIEKVGKGPITLVAKSSGDVPLQSRPLRIEIP